MQHVMETNSLMLHTIGQNKREDKLMIRFIFHLVVVLLDNNLH